MTQWWCYAVLLLLVTIISQTRGQFIFTVLPVDTVLNEGDTLNLTCEAVFAASPSNVLTYTWSRNGTQLSNSSRLMIASVAVSDQGNYSCTVSLGDLIEERRVEVKVQSATGGLSVDIVVMISLLSSLGVVGMITVAVLLFLRFTVCRDKHGRTWNKLHHSLGVRRKSQSSQEELLVSTNIMQRSKSLGQLLSGERTFDDPYDRNLSISTEQLLSGAENTVHPSVNVDFDLDLDERIFDSKKALSDTNLRDSQSGKQDYMRKHSDPHPTSGRPMLSQRTPPSLGSSLASDLGEELSDTSSTLKSVRFDLDDSGVSSDQPSPRRMLDRRYSAPDVKYTREQSPRLHKLVTEAMDDIIDEGLGSEHRLDSDNGLPSNSQSDASGTIDPPIKRRVSQMKERFQQEVKGETTLSESRQRSRSISRRISETTKQLMESKNETTLPVTMTTPKKLVGLDPAVGIPIVLTDEGPEEPVVDTEFELFEQSRKSGLALPFFGGPISSLSAWQPPADDSDDDDDAMVAPIKSSGGIRNVSPLHRVVFGGRFVQLGLMEGQEMFPRHTPSRTPSRKSSASRLTAIPEESPQGSTVTIT